MRPAPRFAALAASPIVALVAALAGVAALAACGGGGGGGGETPAGGEAVRAENAALGIALVVPADSRFELVSNQDAEVRLRFRGDGEFAPGEVVFELAPEDLGDNLFGAVNARKAQAEALPGGQFLGQIELNSQLGSAYNTRVRYTGEDGAEVEEVRIYALHPTRERRLIAMTYRYPPAPGQTEARMMDQSFEAFGYAEPLAPPAGEGEAEGGEAAPPADAGAAGDASGPASDGG